MYRSLASLWHDDTCDGVRDESSQDGAEYAVLLTFVLIVVVGTIRLIGGNANSLLNQTARAVGH
jgi:Flp pilus assembly pilin Flp